MSQDLKPFSINLADVAFLFDQVTFPTIKLIRYDSSGAAIYGYIDASGNSHELGAAGTFDPTTVIYLNPSNSSDPLNNLPLYNGPRDYQGLRNVTGLFNNLIDGQTAWGATGSWFLRLVPPDYAHYAQENFDASGPSNPSVATEVVSHTDSNYTLRTTYVGSVAVSYYDWNRDTTTVDTSTSVVNGHHTQVNTVTTVTTTITDTGAYWVQDSTGSHMVTDGVTTTTGPIVTTNISGGELYPLYHNFNGVTNGVTGPADYSNPLASVVDYTPRMISQMITSSASTVNDVTPDNAMTRSGVATTDVTYDIIDPITKAVVEQNHTETYIENVNSVALDPPYSGWFVLFGQFFDHGLDFIAKPGNGPTIQIPLAVDDPLYGTIGTDGQPVTSITINRATPVAGTGTDPTTNPAQYVNNTSPYIDQSQTYGSIDQITLLLRQWVPDPNNPGHFIAGSQLLDGHTVAAYESKVFDDAGAGLTTRTLPTLNELRAALAATGRADLSWEDISNYRIRDESGQIWDSDGNPLNGIQAVSTGEPILLDNLPRFDNGLGHLKQSALDTLNAAAGRTAGNLLFFDGSGQLADQTLPGVTGFAVLIANGWVDPSTNTITVGDPGLHAAVGEIMLEAVGDHYIAGDGRANENFGLTTIHHVFHEDHNVQRVNLETSILIQANVADINGWQTAVSSAVGGPPTNAHIAVSGAHYVANDGVIAQDTDGNLFVAGASDTLTGGSTFLLTGGAQISAVGSLTDASGYISWNEDRLFNGTKLIVEMEYQHVAIDQYARLVTPDLPEFVTYDSTINANISMEYAESAFRFGHSQLRDTIDALDPNNVVTGNIEHYALASAFLTPEAFAAVGPGAIVEGMTHQIGNETDEFVTPALQQSLLGQPLDLAAINIARGRDLGIPTLNETRKAIYDALVAERAAGGVQAQAHAKIDLGAMKPYDSWNDFLASMAHPESIVNFIAAYSFDGDLDKAQLVVDLASGNPLTANEANLGAALGWTASDAAKFMSNTGSTIAGAGSYDQIDLWLGGLAESHVIGGKLGTTFNAIFEDQMERLMDGDRFYYLYRLFDALPTTLNLNESIVLQQFKDIIERTTGTQYLNGDVMNAADSYVSLYLKPDAAVGDPSVVSTLPGANGATIDPFDHKYGNLTDQLHLGVYTTNGLSTALNGQSLKTLTAADGYRGADGAIIGDYILDARPTSGTTDQNGNPTYGYNSHEVIVGTAFNDYIDGGDGDDTLYGGAGNDILIGNGGGDHIYGGDGNDLIYGSGGTAGADVADFLDGGAGDDVIYGGVNNGSTEIIIGGDGNDFLYGEAGIDEVYGGLGDDYIDTGSDTDVGFGGDGNDYLFGGEGPDTLYGGNGDDIVDGGSGTDKMLGENGDDILMGGIGGGVTQGDSDELIGDAQGVDDGFDLADYSNSSIRLDVAADLTKQNLVAAPGTAHGFQPFNDLYTGINGLVGSKFDDTLIGDDAVDAVDPVAGTPISFSNWLVGGSGSDTLRGNGGNDVIVGGSIKISQLIGTYQDWNGSQWVADSYTSIVDTASHRADPNAVLMGGILDWASLGGSFEKHYTELLKSQARKDFLLGDGGADTGSVDTAVYGGNFGDYTIVAFDANGNVIADPLLNLGSVFALEITDHGDGSVRTLDGADLVIGVENFQFADGTKSLRQLFNHKPTGSVVFTEQDSPTGVTNAANAARFAGLSAIFDADNITPANPTGAVTTGVTFSWTLPTGTLPATATVEASGSLLLHTTSGLLITETGSYVDGGGTAESLSTTYNFIVGSSGNNTLSGADISNGAGGTYGDVIVGLAGIDTLSGGAGEDFLYGGSGNDALNGGAGNDYLDGGVGADQLTGGTGDDTYVVDNYGDVVVENAGEGVDKVQASITYTLGANVENLTLTGSGNINGTGNTLDNVITGNSGNNSLTGGVGNDTIDGGAGTDIAVYTGTALAATFGLSGANLTVSTVADGTDTLTNIERLTFGATTYNIVIGAASLVGTNSADTLTGGTGVDLLLGFGGNDTLNGGGGGDILIGGTGDDTYVIGNTGVTVVENAGEGVDTVRTTVNNYTLGANIENLTLTGSGNISGSGNTLDNILTGNSGNNILTGGGGNDTFIGGAGGDTLNGSAGGKNIYVYTTLTDSLASNFDQITSFGALDQIQIGHTEASVGSVSYGGNAANSLTSRLGSALSGANSLGAGAVDVVQLTGGGTAGTYLVIDNGVAGFNASVDAVIKINSGSGNIAAASFV
jgi:Ca2+-binding RTX toxin-like protein